MKAWDLFVEYNQIDVDRVVEMEDKLGLLSLSLAMSYLTKINYSDVYSPVKCWECYILSTLMNEKTFVAVKREHHSGDGIEGAFIAEPDPGFYGWVLSIDATALYPSFIIGLNMSPETLMGMDPDCSVQNFLSGLSKSDTEYAYAANGAYFRKDVQGVLPRLAQKVLDGRAIAKKEMLRLKQLHIDTGDEKYKKLSALQNTFQGAFKVLNNALFGSLANAGFIFFDTRIAEGITMTGQFGIQHVGNHCNKRFNDFFKTKDQKYNIYSDTDSIFFTFQNIVDKYYSDKTDLQITDALDKLMEQHLRKLVDEATDEIAIRQNFYKKTLFFKRENICSGGFWLAKKKYALKVYDSEGVRYPEGDYKIMGIEVVRSSTPEMAREALKECVALIIDKNLDALRLKVDEVHKQFLSFSPELIAFPRSANNLLEYSDDTRIYKKGTPIAVRGTLLHNHYLKHLKITNLYQEIREGDKIKFIYLKEPNHIKENIIAFIDKLPDEFRLDKYIDRETQFEKVFMAPLIHILDAVKWKLVEEQSLDDFFG